MLKSKKDRAQTGSIEMDKDAAYTLPRNCTLYVRERRYKPPQYYVKLLAEGSAILNHAWETEPVSMQLFFQLAQEMEKNNLIRISLKTVAERENITYNSASQRMSKLVQTHLLCRTGTRSLWMLNPSVVTKCSEDECIALQEVWKRYIQEDAVELPTGTLGLEGEKESSTTKESNNVSA